MRLRSMLGDLGELGEPLGMLMKKRIGGCGDQCRRTAEAGVEECMYRTHEQPGLAGVPTPVHDDWVVDVAAASAVAR